jgi:hypothetical protein
MKKKDKTKTLVDNLGKGARLAYLEQHPHGFGATTKVHKSSKKYNRTAQKTATE